MTKKFNNFQEFWPFYVKEHSKSLTRKLHFIGTLSIFPIAASAVLYSAWLFVALPISAYGFAWYAHYVVEKNRPATFIHPLWSLIADFKMFFMMCLGEMDKEVQRCKQL